MTSFRERLEVGPWLQAGRPLDGAEAFSLLAQRALSEAVPRPYCIYIHVPFCSSRCSFCALYTNIVTEGQDETSDRFSEILMRSIREHPQRGKGTAPTTVHFGGGTPMFLGAERLRRLNETIRDHFGDSESCEWALETTTSSVTPSSMQAWLEAGFSRVHLGVQTLNEDLRRRIGRHETASAVLEKIRNLLAADFLVSVDLIIGLAGSNEEILAGDLEQLHEAGIRMFSICELRHLRQTETRQQNRVAESERNFGYWEVIWDFMSRQKLVPIHLGQFARGAEDNLYFTHPARGEDCIALGPYAHGSSGHIYYSNKLLPEFESAIRSRTSPIEAGVAYRAGEQRIRQMESELLTHSVRPETVAAMEENFADGFRRVWDSLRADGLIAETAGRSYRVTRSGGWFLGNIIHEMRGLSDD